MGTLYIDRKGIHVKLDGNALAFYANNEREGMVPITPLKRVIVIGTITVETSALNRLADENITVIFLSGRRMRFHGMLHGRLHNNGFLRVKQYEKSLSDFATTFSREIVARKVNTQQNFLKDTLPQRPDLRFPLTTAITTLSKISGSLNSIKECDYKQETINFKPPEGLLDSLRGFEGSAAAAYFSAYTNPSSAVCPNFP